MSKDIAKDKNNINAYISELDGLFKGGNVTEHSYRPALQRLMEKITVGLSITNEPKRIACGAPDYIVTRKEIPVGYIEAKDIGIDLDGKNHKEQFDRYKISLNNLIITDYLNFRLFQNGEQTCSATIGFIDNNNKNNKNIKSDPSQFIAFLDLIRHFVNFHYAGIVTAEQLSKMMAVKAKFIAKIIEQTLKDDSEITNSLTLQLESFRNVLIHDMPETTFADIYSQTVAYGMFAARINDVTKKTFTRVKAAELVPQSNPFLQKLFQYIAYNLDERISWAVDALADLFNYIDVDELLKEFNQTNQDYDPMLHFYETFLAEYDPALRKSRGVWYTPQPIVQFIVKAVDDILKQEFKMPLGLADRSKIKTQQKTQQENNIETKNKTITKLHKVQILDPATGTGTFLAEIIKNIHQNFEHQQGTWNNYVVEHLIPRLNGFEILMAPYVMAHLKLDMQLRKTGYTTTDNKRLHVYLTNSLEETSQTQPLPFAEWLSDECNAASHIKTDVPVMIVLGNPPYNISSQNKNEWIQNLIGNYKIGLKEKNIQPLSDDYIKFIRYGQYCIEKSSQGIMAYISNNSFIDGLIYRQMRKSLLESFDKIYIFDLHGNTRKKETTPNNKNDKNVFDIQQGVSINIFIKNNKKKNNKLADVFHAELYGTREEKYKFLSQKNIKNIKWRQLKINDDNYFFVPKNFALRQSYEKGFKIDELFCKYTSGIKTHNDKELVSFDAFKNNNQLYNYRPFDVRYIEYDLQKIVRHRYDVMKHVMHPNNISLCTCRQQSTFNFQHIFVTKYLADICSVSLQTKETTFIFPLYIYADDDMLKDDGVSYQANFSKVIVDKISDGLGLSFVDERIGAKTKRLFSAMDLLDYIYAVLYSRIYRGRYKEFLKIDFPRIPYPCDVTIFWQMVELGSRLRRYHLFEDIEPSKNVATFPIGGANKIEKQAYIDGNIWINSKQYFGKVPLEAYEFYVGGYQPAQKWLKDRRNRSLSYDDIQHYQKIITTLIKTIEIQKKLDEINFLNIK
ncbi:MAG: N-6 DNA methylase [Planctomycetaceae bacterium]|jgi:predicted helicase|nr:N-6 DNA methylase [Planctomycetaceae bacterium]